MYVEFIGLPGSGKSTLLEELKKLMTQAHVPCRTLNEAAEDAHASLVKQPGYFSRKPGRGWLGAVLAFAHTYPEVFRILFENTLANSWENRIVMDLPGQFQLAKKARTSRELILCDEGFLHRGAVAYSQSAVYSDLETYLAHLPLCNVLVHIALDTKTAISRCKTRRKGLPVVYKPLTEEQVIGKMTVLGEMHQKCLQHQEASGVHVIRLDGMRPVKELSAELFDSLIKLRGPDPQKGG